MRTLSSFEATLEAAKIDLGSLELRPDGTVGSVALSGDDTDPGAAPDLAALLGSGEDLTLDEVIGEGGMGVVHEARQASLGRTVAVKKLREESQTRERAAAFVQEARITGALEHPNIVPIHGLGIDEDGSPLIVMKRIFGRSWLSLIEASLGEAGHLEAHLPILSAVCHALELAHARGVLHRDLKPDNVLVGDYGEVLVVDWGVALAFEDPPLIEGMATTRGVRQVVGTPRYMAPEMATGDGRAFGRTTDVYLLGATLHHVLTGEPRHDGPTLMAMLYSAYASEPREYGPEVDPELGAIANRACHVDPAQRYPDVASFRAALERYERHAGSRALARDATRRLEAEDPDLVLCRFGFEQALAAWPENALARDGLVRTLGHEIERALEGHRLEDARARLEELETVEGAVVEGATDWHERVAQLRSRIEAESSRVARLEDHAREQDLGAAASTRRIYGIAFSLLFLGYNTFAGILSLTGVIRVDHLGYSVGAFLVAAVVGLATIPRFRMLVPNRASKRLMRGLAVLLGAQVPVFLSLGVLGLSLERSLAVSLFQLGGSFFLQATSLETRIEWVALVAVALGAAAFAWPSIAFFAVGLAYATFFTVGSLLRFDLGDEPTPQKR